MVDVAVGIYSEIMRPTPRAGPRSGSLGLAPRGARQGKLLENLQLNLSMVVHRLICPLSILVAIKYDTLDTFSPLHHDFLANNPGETSIKP